MSDVNNRAYDTDVLDTLSKRAPVGDGAMGTEPQTADAVMAKYVRLHSG